MVTKEDLINKSSTRTIDIDKIEDIFSYLDTNKDGIEAIYFKGKKWSESVLDIVAGKYVQDSVNHYLKEFGYNYTFGSGDALLELSNGALIILKDYFKDNGENALKYFVTDDEVTETSGQNVYDIIDECIVYNLDTISTVKDIVRTPTTLGTVFNDYIDLRNSPRKGVEIYADSGADVIYATRNNDTVYAGNGNDYVEAGKGDDTIYGSLGDDTISGGAGNNKIVYNEGDGFDTITLTKYEQLTINMNDIDTSSLTYKLDGDDLYINKTTVDSEGNEQTENYICIQDFSNKSLFATKSIAPASPSSSGNIAGGAYPATEAKARPYIPAFNIDVVYDGDEENLINLNTKVYDVETTSNYEGKWVTERIDASEATSGISISGNEGNDTIIGSSGNDTISGGWGDNTIVYNTYECGDDTITLTQGENLIIDVSGWKGNYNPNYRNIFNEQYVDGNDLVLSETSIVYNEETEDYETVDSSIRIKDFTVTNFEKYGGSAKLLFNDGVTVDLKNDLLLDTRYIKGNYNGTSLADDITAEYSDKAVTIKAKGGNDNIVGSEYDDTINGGTGRNTINIYTKESFGNDTVVLTKNEQLQLKLADADSIDYTNISLNGDNLVIQAYNQTGYDLNGNHNGELQGTITIKNYKKSDVITNFGSFVILNRYNNVIYDVRDDFYINTTMDSSHYAKTSFSGSWLNDNINALNSDKGVNIKSGKGNDVITGSAVNDTITGGLGTNTINVKNGTFGSDTINLTKNENLVIDMTEYNWNIAALKQHLKFSGNDLLVQVDNNNVLRLKNFAKTNVVGAAGTVKIKLADDVFFDLNNDEFLSYTKDDFTYNSSKNAYVFNGTRFDESITSVNAGAGTIISGGAGYNNIIVSDNLSSSDTIKGGNDGNYITVTKDGNKSITTGNGIDTINIVGDGIHTIKAGDGLNTVVIDGNGKATVTGGKIADDITVKNNASETIIKAGNGDNEIKVLSCAGKSTITTGNGDDTITVTGSGNAVIKSNAGDDTIIGGLGNDTINGGIGNDEITAGNGNDKIIGGKGNNTFIFNTGDGKDTITDSKNTDTLKLYCDESTVKYSKSGNNLVISYGTSDEITLTNYFKQANGTSISNVFINDIRQNKWEQNITNTISKKGKISDTVYNDKITGSTSNDTYTITNSGDDTISDLIGNDKYTIKKTDGSLSISDSSGDDRYTVNSLDNEVVITDNSGVDSLVINNYNKILFAFNVNKSGIMLDNNLYIAETTNDFLSSNSSITIKDYFTETGKIENIQIGKSFADIDIIKQNVVNWLKSNGYDSSIEVLQTHHQSSDISALIAEYTYVKTN